ncbi:MAG TPA: alpha/beta hydrolase, partial [Pyrinomonadaceae bacterium]|nr:alpha/beta hydrolase [Pyrinomonadaceae bacterium]
MKNFTPTILLLGLCLLVTVQCNKATVNSSDSASSRNGQEGAEIDYSAPAGAPFTAEEVTVSAKDFKLAGTLLLPKSGARPFPAVITITGSGQQTRDEPIPIPGLEKYRPMRQIAEALASRGIAVLRVDDRGTGKSGGRETLLKATTSSFADDVRAEVAYLRSRPEIDPAR